jgi:hypothetical protein
MTISLTHPTVSSLSISLPSSSPVYLVQGHTTPYPPEGSLDHFQTPRNRQRALTLVPLVPNVAPVPLILDESSRLARRDLFGASHPNLVASAFFFKKMLYIWQYLPLAADNLINRINSHELSNWHFVYVAPMNIFSNFLSVTLLPVITIINALASVFFLARFVKYDETQDLKCTKFFLKGLQITTVLGFVNFSKALFPGLPITNILRHYRSYAGFEEIALDL